MTKRAIIPMLCLVAAPAFAGTDSGEKSAMPSSPATPVAQRSGCAEAILLYQEALAANPGDAVLHNKLGICYLQTGDQKRARREFESAAKLDPKLAEAWNNLGTLDHVARKYGRAVTRYQKAIQLRPTYAVAFKNMGSAYLAKNDVEKGLAAYKEALRLDPNVFADSVSPAIVAPGLDVGKKYFYLAKLSAASGHVDAALDLLARARSAGFAEFDKVRRDPDFKAVVGDARFATVIP
jgi:tetratricopeptide (TPR) repeat protein